MIQQPLFRPQTEWLPPEEFPDLSKYEEIAIDLETKDPNLNTKETWDYLNEKVFKNKRVRSN